MARRMSDQDMKILDYRMTVRFVLAFLSVRLCLLKSGVVNRQLRLLPRKGESAPTDSQ